MIIKSNLKDPLFQIPGGNDNDAAAAFNIAALAAITHVNKFCGRFFNLQSAMAASSTVCSKFFFLLTRGLFRNLNPRVPLHVISKFYKCQATH